MNTIKMTMSILAGPMLSLSLICGGCASTTGDSDKERLYTPVALYFDPLAYIDPCYSATEYFPLFVNYPNGWTKFGLHGSPMFVTYDFDNTVHQSQFTVKASFNQNGQLTKTYNSLWGFSSDFSYNEDGELVDIMRFYPLSRQTYMIPSPTYNEGKIVSWRKRDKGRLEIFSGITDYKFEYYSNGTIKALTPTFTDDEIDKYSPIGLFEFNEEGQLISTKSPFTANPFFRRIDARAFDINSESTFTYNEQGLCIEKRETLTIRNKMNGISVPDTVVSVDSYSYNKNGDLEKWIYKGGTIETSNGTDIHIDHVEFSCEYYYEYDDYMNWTSLLLIMPSNFKTCSALEDFYRNKKVNSPYTWESPSYDSTRSIVFKRKISYYENLQGDSHVSNEKEGESAAIEERPKYMGVMAYGLQGPVKMVKNETEKQTTVFNKIGSIESFISANGYRDCNNTYIYESPIRYKKGDIPYRIDITDNVMRIICEPDEEIFEFEDEYKFDSQGRVISHVWHDGMSPVTREFVYHGDSRLPYKEIESSFDELGDWSTTINYEYIDIDKHGNWTKRIGTTHSVTNDYEDVQNEDGEWEYNGGSKTTESTDTVEETRKISYY